MATITPENLKDRLMLRVQEYAELTGTPLPSVYRYLALGKLRGIRIGSSLRIPVAAVVEQLEKVTMPAPKKKTVKRSKNNDAIMKRALDAIAELAEDNTIAGSERADCAAELVSRLLPMMQGSRYIVAIALKGEEGGAPEQVVLPVENQEE